MVTESPQQNPRDEFERRLKGMTKDHRLKTKDHRFRLRKVFGSDALLRSESRLKRRDLWFSVFGLKCFPMFLLLLFCCGITNCGYTTRSTLASHLRSIHIESFVNNVSYTTEGRRNLYFPLLEIDTRNAIIDRFQFDGNLKIAKPEDADLILKGELTGYDRNVLRFTDNDDVEEYRVYIYVSLELYDTRTQQVKWTEGRFTGEATYFFSGPLATSEESAVDEAIEDLARRIVERTVEDW